MGWYDIDPEPYGLTRPDNYAMLSGLAKLHKCNGAVAFLNMLNQAVRGAIAHDESVLQKDQDSWIRPMLANYLRCDPNEFQLETSMDYKFKGRWHRYMVTVTSPVVFAFDTVWDPYNRDAI